MDNESHSLCLMKSILSQVEIYCYTGHIEEAIDFLNEILISGWSVRVSFPMIYKMLTDEHLTYLLLQYIHVVAYEEIGVLDSMRTGIVNFLFPILPWKFIRNQTQEKLKSLLDKIRNIFNDSIEKWKRSRTSTKGLFPLCYNYIYFESSFANMEDARLLAQQFLRNDKENIQFWQLYANAEQVFIINWGVFFFKKSKDVWKY